MQTDYEINIQQNRTALKKWDGMEKNFTKRWEM